MDDAQQLVGGGHRGVLVVAAHGQGLVVAAELVVVGPGGGLGALDERLPEGGVASPGSPAAAFAGALVVARADPGPDGAVSGGGEHADVRAQFDENGVGAVPVDARDGHEQVDLRLVADRLIPTCPSPSELLAPLQSAI